jgi:hypothetical protein
MPDRTHPAKYPQRTLLLHTSAGYAQKGLTSSTENLFNLAHLYQNVFVFLRLSNVTMESDGLGWIRLQE